MDLEERVAKLEEHSQKLEECYRILKGLDEDVTELKKYGTRVGIFALVLIGLNLFGFI